MGKHIPDEAFFSKEANEGFKKAEQESINKERERFKQDCRKRALDWAMEKDFSGGPDHVVKQADKYYKWLISIPETK